MRREVLLAALLATLVAAPARAQDAGSGRDAATRDGAPASAAAPPEPGADEGDGDDPHGGGGTKNPDRVIEDARLPAGTIAVQVLDASNAPMPRTAVTLGILKNTVAKGESREHKTETTDDQGRIVFRDLPTGTGIAYRVSVTKDGGQFAATPFGLALDKGTIVMLHVYPVTGAIMSLEQLSSMEQVRAVTDRAVVLVEGILYVELKDDRVQMQQLYRVMNAGSVAWVPKDLILPLPSDFTSFVNDTQAMSDVGLDAVAGKGLRLHGTFAPGQHEVTFRWQLPYDGEERLTFEVEPPPNTVSMRVMAAASQEMRFSAEGFPPGEPQDDGRGSRVLMTQRAIRRGEPMISKVKLSLTDIPRTVPIAARLTVVILAALAVALGIALGARRRATSGADAKERRALLLADLEELVRAHRAGEIGPKTFERARRELYDAIARTLPVPPAPSASAAQSTAR